MSFDSIKDKYDPSVLKVLELSTLLYNGGNGMNKLEKAQREASIKLKGDLRQIISADSLSQINILPNALKEAHKALNAKWWRTTEGKLTSRSPTLDVKDNHIVVYMEVAKKGYYFYIPYNKNDTRKEICSILDPMIEQAGIKVGSKYGPTILSFGYFRIEDNTTLESKGVTEKCLLYATHIKR